MFERKLALDDALGQCSLASSSRLMTGGKSSWSHLTFESIPSAVVLGSKRVDAVGLASDDHVYHKSLVDSSWSTNWDDLGGPLNGAPVAASFAPNTGNILGIGMDNSLYIGN